jgi:hypothetical protein
VLLAESVGVSVALLVSLRDVERVTDTLRDGLNVRLTLRVTPRVALCVWETLSVIESVLASLRDCDDERVSDAVVLALPV